MNYLLRITISITICLLFITPSRAQDSTEIYKNYLCKTWRLAEGNHPGNCEVSHGWRLSTTNYLMDSLRVSFTTYYSDNTFKSKTTIRNSISKSDSVIVTSGNWNLNFVKKTLEESTLMINDNPTSPIIFEFDLIILANDTLKTEFQTRGGQILRTYIPSTDN